MFFRNNPKPSYPDSESRSSILLKPFDDNIYNKATSGINLQLQPSLYPSNTNSILHKRDKTPPVFRAGKKDSGHESKNRSEMSLESPERGEGGEDDKSLRVELQETKSKMKTITTKLTTMRKERDQLQKDNKVLQEEVLFLQASLRQMIPGFANTSSSFPMLNELITNVAEFYKCECEDVFFDLLCPELSIKGVVYFFQTSFSRMLGVISGYFSLSESLLKKTACMEELEGPVMNALRKCYQSTWRDIIEKCVTPNIVTEMARDLQMHLKLGKLSSDTRYQIESFLQKMGELVLCFYVSDPPLTVNCDTIGSKVMFNPMKHEALDGFIKGKEECIIILPSVHKNTVEGDLVGKALVLQVGYEMAN